MKSTIFSIIPLREIVWNINHVSALDTRKKACFKPFFESTMCRKIDYSSKLITSAENHLHTQHGEDGGINDTRFVHETIIKKLIFYIFIFSFSSSLSWKNNIMENIVLFTFCNYEIWSNIKKIISKSRIRERWQNKLPPLAAFGRKRGERSTNVRWRRTHKGARVPLRF